MDQKKRRNFCIIAHIDHGKSTLADRLLETTATIDTRKMRNQLLDNMSLEQERGITIKSHAIQMRYAWEGEDYVLNLIDTPGHVDFSYEVSRAIAACEGALLVVDAAQGVQAQTIANLYLALGQDLTILPVLNKVDLPNARVEEVTEEVVDLLGCSPEEVLHVSAKEGIGIEELLAAIIQRVPAPQGDATAPLQAMVFDAMFDPFKGVEVYYRIFNGTLKKGDTISFLQTKKTYHADEIGILKLEHVPQASLGAGDVGYLTGSIKSAQEVKIGDTLTKANHPCEEAIKGFSEVKPMLFAGLYPVDSSDYPMLRTALEKLQLNDASLVWEHETSTALGLGFRCGFLGMLHMEIIQERLWREFNMEVITTAPSVQFRVMDRQENAHIVHAATAMPPPAQIAFIEEPIMKVQIISNHEFIGPIIQLCMEKRGMLEDQQYITPKRVELQFQLPLAEIAFDFFDKLKTISKGYASLDYSFSHFQRSDMVRLDILLNGDKVDAFSAIIHRDKAYRWGKKLCEKLKDLLPRHLFEIPIQAAIGGKVIARETVRAIRKNVIAKCYGGDITRKRKLLEKQKAGKKRMRQVGSVEVPQEAFHALLKVK
ncbi:MAG: translation elongation factor 4 [Bacteroidota bacterium]